MIEDAWLGETKHSFGTLWSRTDPFYLVSCASQEMVGVVMEMNSLVIKMQKYQWITLLPSFILLGDNEESELQCRHFFGLPHLDEDSFFSTFIRHFLIF